MGLEVYSVRLGAYTLLCSEAWYRSDLTTAKLFPEVNYYSYVSLALNTF